MIDWYKKVVFENFANFSGRARRSEFWYFVLVNCIISTVFTISSLSIFDTNASLASMISLISGLYSLAIFIPNLAVTVRRLHDVGKSGWYYFIVLIPLLGVILLLYWFCQEGELNENKWGHNPKDNYSDIDEIGA